MRMSVCKKKTMARGKVHILVLIISAFVTFTLCDDQELESDNNKKGSLRNRINSNVKTDLSDASTKKKLYLKRFAQSWKYYAKANDIAKREKLRKALLDALKSMNTKRKTTVTSITHDTVERIQHAAHMLKEFKRMYKLSNDVMSSWKDYDSARKSLLAIGKTQEGGDILKKYVTMRDHISNHIRRSQIEKPSIVDDEDIDQNIAKDSIARHAEMLTSGSFIVQKAVTPGTLQIKRSKVKNERKEKEEADAEAAKRMELLSDAKEAARAAYSKAKAAISALKEKIKGASVSEKEKANKTETNDKGTNKKSDVVEGENHVKEESLGHLNPEMAISSMIKKAEKEDLAKIGGSMALSGTINNSASKEANSKVQSTNESNPNAHQEAVGVVLNSTKIQEKATKNDQDKSQNALKVGPTTSISSLMDSLAEGEESQTWPTVSQSKQSNETKPQENPLFLGPSTMEVNGSSKWTPNDSTQNTAESVVKNATEKVQDHTQDNASNASAIQSMKLLLVKSMAGEQKEVTVSSLPIVAVKQNYPPAASNQSGTMSNQNRTMSNNTDTNSRTGSKRFQLSELKIRQEVAKTIDRQLETLKRLQDAKKARRKYEFAKRELQSKIKKLYDMAVSFEKPIKEAQQETRTVIASDEHPGAALAGITDKVVSKVNTPSDDGEHHGFTLGAMDSKSTSKAHIVDLNNPHNEKPVEKVYQVGLQETNTADGTRKSESGVNDQALKSLTDAIKNDLKRIEENQKLQEKARQHSNDLNKLLSKFTTEKGSASVVDAKPTQKSDVKPETVLQALADKKDKPSSAPSKETDETVDKAQDAFKEVEDYLSRALKHVAKEAINEENTSEKDTGLKEVSDVINEDRADNAKAKSEPSKVKPDSDKEVEASTEKKEDEKKEIEKKEDEKKENDKQDKKEDEKKDQKNEETEKTEKDNSKGEAKSKTNEMDRNERLRKIVEDAMKEHAKDPKNPHPVNADLLKPTEKLKSPETTAKVVDESKTKEKDVKDQSTASVHSASPTTSSSTTTSTSASNNGVVSRSSNDAIAKAEHLEEQVANLQDKLYTQGAANDAYKSIDSAEQKPLFSQESQESNPEEQPMYQEPIHHHSHRRHHHNDEEEADDRGRDDEDNDDDDDYDDDEEDPREREYDDDEEEDEDDKRKKSFLQSYRWQQPYRSYRPYRNYQRDRILSRQENIKQQQQKQQAPMMNTGMMNDEERDELEDSKKSTVPTAANSLVRAASEERSKMYIL